MQNKRFWTILSLAMALSLLLAACASPTSEVVEVEKVVTKEVEKVVTEVVEVVVTATPEPKAPGGGTFVGGINDLIVSIDAHKAIEFSDSVVNPLVYEPLVAMGADGEWKGVLAESWEASDDGLTWTFHLRQGVKFHNGREMTADDVIFNLDRILDESTGAPMQSYYANKIASYEAVDPYTVKFVLSDGAGTFLSEIGLGMRTAIIAKECVTQDNNIVHPIGTGPFEFLWWKPGEEWRAKRFDDYWGEVAKIDEVVFKPILDATVRLIALQTGEIDWMMQIPYEQMLEMQENPSEDIVLELLYEARTLRLNFNATRPPFNDARMRQAVAYAIDKEEFNEAVMFGLANPHNQPFVPGSFLYLDLEDPYRASNIEKAKSLMAEAGYADGVEVDVLNWPGYTDDWEVLQTYVRQIGIKDNARTLESAQWAKAGQELDYDIMLASQSSIYHWDRTFSYFDKDSSANWLVGGYHNDDVAALLVKGRDEADLNKAKEIYTEVFQTLQDDAAAVFLAAEPTSRAWRSWVKGYDPNASNTYLVWPGGGLNYVTLDEKPEQ